MQISDLIFLLVVSIDGLSWDQLQQQRAKLPTLSAVIDAGVHGPAETVFPSVTWPAHTSAVTGRTPRHHGVLGNYFCDRATGYQKKIWRVPGDDLIRARTLWQVAKAAGLSTGAVLWPATQGSAGLDWNIPEIYDEAEYERFVTPGLLDALASDGVPARRFARHSKTEGFLLDRLAREAAVHVIKRHRPRLMLAHFVAADTYGHKMGPDSPEMVWALERTDAHLAALLAAYRASGVEPNVLIMSDHGFSPVRWRFDADRLLKRRDIPVRATANGYVAFLYSKDDAALEAAVAALSGHELDVVSKVFEPTEYHALGLPTPWEDPRIGDRLVLAKPHAYFKITTNGRVAQDLTHAGMHGHLPQAPGNKAFFAAAGPAFRQRKAPLGLRLVDLAPIAARVLETKFSGPIEGLVPDGILR